MNSRILALCIFLATLALAAPACAQPYSVREVGFVDVELKPYRLMLLAQDLAVPAVKKQQANFEKELANSNIVLVAQQADAKSLTPDKKPIGNLTTPHFWLIAPDDRVIPFHAAGPMADLVQSPLRQQILHEVTNSLCAVLLLESDDMAANEIAKAKVQVVLAELKKVRKQLHHAPDADLEMLSLPVADRPRERWTLWGLGEEVAAPKTPKVAIVFGKMRRAGPLFEGIDWNNDDLFARVVALGQACEDELDRKEFFGPPLPFQWPNDWLGQLGLPFDPLSEKVVKEMATILQTPVLPDDQRTQRRLTPGAFDPGDEIIMIVEPARSKSPGFFSGQTTAILMIVVGGIGWVLLGVSVLILENRKPSQPRQAPP